MDEFFNYLSDEDITDDYEAGINGNVKRGCSEASGGLLWSLGRKQPQLRGLILAVSIQSQMVWCGVAETPLEEEEHEDEDEIVEGQKAEEEEKERW